MARKPAFEELEKRMFGRSYFLEAEEGFRRHVMPAAAANFLNKSKETYDE